MPTCFVGVFTWGLGLWLSTPATSLLCSPLLCHGADNFQSHESRSPHRAIVVAAHGVPHPRVHAPEFYALRDDAGGQDLQWNQSGESMSSILSVSRAQDFGARRLKEQLVSASAEASVRPQRPEAYCVRLTHKNALPLKIVPQLDTVRMLCRLRKREVMHILQSAELECRSPNLSNAHSMSRVWRQ